MAETTLTDPTVFPSFNQVEKVLHDGDLLTEKTVEKLIQGLTVHGNSALTGLAPSEGAGLAMNVGAGEALIHGRHVIVDASASHTMPNGVSGQLLVLRLKKTSDLVTSVVLADVSAPGGDYDTYNDVQADDLIIASVTTSGGAITSWVDERRYKHGPVCGRYTGDNSSLRTITLARTPIKVAVASSNEGIYSIGELSVPGHRRFDSNQIPDSSDGHPAVWFRDPATVTQNKKILEGSKTWDPGTVIHSSETFQTTDVTVTGATVGDPVIGVSHSGADGSYEVAFEARVISASTVRVWIWSIAGTQNVPSGTLRVYVYDRDVDGFDATTFVHGGYTDTWQDKRTPQITQGGFRVGHDVTAGTVSLNATGQLYDWIAWF